MFCDSEEGEGGSPPFSLYCAAGEGAPYLLSVYLTDEGHSPSLDFEEEEMGFPASCYLDGEGLNYFCFFAEFNDRRGARPQSVATQTLVSLLSLPLL